MLKFSIRRMLAALALPALVLMPGHEAQANGPGVRAVKNIILMISDGCGYNQIAATDLWDKGTTGTQVYEHFPVQFPMAHWSIGKSYDTDKAWNDFDYLKNGPATDSAAAGTAMSTGRKTCYAAIGYVDGTSATDPNLKIGKHVIEYAEAEGMATGVVTTVQWSHATPAAFVAHNPSRNDYVGIAREMVTSSTCEVIMGAGHPYFNDGGVESATVLNSARYVGGIDTWNMLAAGTLVSADCDNDGAPDAWTLVQTREEFQNLATTANPPKRVCGTAQVATTLQQGRAGDAKAPPYTVALNSNVPTLAMMTMGAINVLQRDTDGFFLMVEGGAIDWASHSNQSGRLIEEEMDFNRAVEAVVAWVESNSNWNETLVIVTGDHETGFLQGPAAGTINPLVSNGQGTLPGMRWNSANHTNSLIPLFAKGPAGVGDLLSSVADQSDLRRGKFIDNTELGQILIGLVEGTMVPVELGAFDIE